MNSPNGGERFTETIPVNWESTSSDGTILNVNFSALSYFGVTYPLAEGLPASGSASLDVSALPDGRYLLKIEAYDSLRGEFSFYQADFSDSLFVIDNPGNSRPFIEIESDFLDVLNGDVEIAWTAIDFEDSTLTISIGYSIDNGTHWEPVAEEIQNSGSHTWISRDFPNSDSAMISLTAFDGDSSATVYSGLFKLKNVRQNELDDVFSNLIGNGQGPLTLNIIDSTLLTGNNYTLSFREDAVSGDLVYDVFDLDEGIVEITGAFETFGAEGPLFDGMRLSIFDFHEVLAWKTEWIELIGDTSSYGVEFFLHNVIDLSDYEVRFLGEGADSATGGGKTVPFQIWNVSDVPHKKVDFTIVPTAGEWASGDRIVLSVDGIFSRSFIFTWDETDTPPQTGDVLKLFTGRPREAGDLLVFNSEGAPIGIDGENKKIPDAFNLSQNYPNPFNPLTNIRYSLPVRSEVSLIIYNLRGQEVARLIDGEERPAGVHTAVWDASTTASGLYFYRLTAGDYVKTRKMILIK